VIQDSTGAILLRLGDEAGAVRGGQLIEVAGKRSTKSGMLSIQVSAAPAVLGTGTQPTAVRRATGAAGEVDEARVIVARGAVVAAARRSSSGSISFEIDDGSGPLRVFAGSSLDLDRSGLVAGAWVEAVGPLGQETTGSQPTRGYRIWLRGPADLSIAAGATGARVTDEDGPGTAAGSSGEAASSASIGDLLEGTRIDGAVSVTLAAGRWPELGLGAVAWDGARIAGIVDDAAARALLPELLAAHPPPVRVTVVGIDPAGRHAASGLPLLRLRAGSRIELDAGAPAAPALSLPDGGDPAWVALVGRIGAEGRRLDRDDDQAVTLDAPCPVSPMQGVHGLAQVVGIGRAAPPRIIVACDGVHRGPQLVTATVSRATGSVDALPSAAVQPDGAPLLIVGLACAVAAACLVAVGIVARHRRRASGPEPAITADVEASASDGPRLTLVPVHRERGSP
jgi:hypothetical protein